MARTALVALGLLAAAASSSNSAAKQSAPTVSLTIVAWYDDENLGEGDDLFLRGNFSSLTWAAGLGMMHVGVDQWAASLSVPVAELPSALAFKALVDDSIWAVGANEQAWIPADAAPGTNWTLAVYPFFGLYGAGTLATLPAVFSPQLNNTRDLILYLPPSYYENTHKVFGPESVLVMHDGQNLFNASTASFGVAWMAQDTLDALIPEGAMREVVIVGVDNTPQRIYEYTYSVDPTVGTGGGADLYIDFLEQTVLPAVQAAFRVSADAAPQVTAGHGGGAAGRWEPRLPLVSAPRRSSHPSPLRQRVVARGTPPRGSPAAPLATAFPAPTLRWAMLGSSLGGLLSCYAAWSRPTVWGRVGCMSSSFWWNNEDFLSTVLPTQAGHTPLSSLYLDSGNAGPSDDDVNGTIAVRDALQGLGYPLLPAAVDDSAPGGPLRSLGYYLDKGGQHSEAYWGARFHIPAAYLFPPSLSAAVEL